MPPALEGWADVVGAGEVTTVWAWTEAALPGLDPAALVPGVSPELTRLVWFTHCIDQNWLAPKSAQRSLTRPVVPPTGPGPLCRPARLSVSTF